MRNDQFSVIVPTMWRCLPVFQKALREYINHPLVHEIIIINNDISNTPQDWPELNDRKVWVVDSASNIYVNPAWNLGVVLSSCDKICLANDDIWFDPTLFDKIQGRLTPAAGVHGIVAGEEKFNQPVLTDGAIDFIEWKWGDNIHGFGQLMFFHKSTWLPIIPELKVYFGDDYIFHSHLMAGRTNYMIANIKYESPYAATSKDKSITGGFYEAELPHFTAWSASHPIPSRPGTNPVKTILIAIPTNKYIEPETFKAVYDLEVPDGYKTEFQFFYGYQIDQIRNLIAHWAVNYDYLFSVDSDISFKPDTLKKLLEHDRDIVSGLYIQRKPGQHILELYRNGRNVPYDDIKGMGLVEVDGCGFGCVLVKSAVLRAVGYPQFVYKSAIDHANTVSEDTYFCAKAKGLGFGVYADTTILCEHIGSTKFVVDAMPPTPKPKSIEDRLLELSNVRMLPAQHTNYLFEMAGKGVSPSVVYDIGACVLHWTREAVNVWPAAQYFAFDAMPECAAVYNHFHVPHAISVLSDQDGKRVEFWENKEHPGGNTYYEENEQINPTARKGSKRVATTITLDTLVTVNQFPLPDLIKMDVQGAEMDVLKGAAKCLANCTDVILELQRVDYNKGAPLRDEVIAYMSELGFQLKKGPFCDNGPDGDYHFQKVQ